jgi:hypothetical protein
VIKEGCLTSFTSILDTHSSVDSYDQLFRLARRKRMSIVVNVWWERNPGDGKRHSDIYISVNSRDQFFLRRAQQKGERSEIISVQIMISETWSNLILLTLETRRAKSKVAPSMEPGAKTVCSKIAKTSIESPKWSP